MWTEYTLANITSPQIYCALLPLPVLHYCVVWFCDEINVLSSTEKGGCTSQKKGTRSTSTITLTITKFVEIVSPFAWKYFIFQKTTRRHRVVRVTH